MIFNPVNSVNPFGFRIDGDLIFPEGPLCDIGDYGGSFADLYSLLIHMLGPREGIRNFNDPYMGYAHITCDPDEFRAGLWSSVGVIYDDGFTCGDGIAERPHSFCFGPRIVIGNDDLTANIGELFCELTFTRPGECHHEYDFLSASFADVVSIFGGTNVSRQIKSLRDGCISPRLAPEVHFGGPESHPCIPREFRIPRRKVPSSPRGIAHLK